MLRLPRGRLRRPETGPRLLAVVAAVALLASAARAAPPTGHVGSVRRGLVYIDLGREDGVRMGDQLSVGRARLEVVTLGAKQLVAKPTNGRRVRRGATVSSPREPGAPGSTRPVVTLAKPTAAPEALPWAGGPPRRAKLILSPHEKERRRPKPTGLHGELLVSYAGMFDQSATNLDLHQIEVRSKLADDDLLGGRLSYRHDIAGRAELGPNLGFRQGHDSRPYYKIRELRLRYRSPGWHDSASQSPFGAFEASIGRLRLPVSPSVGLLDGARAALALGRGFSAGIHGGLAPNLLDIGLSSDVSVVGAHASWARAGDDWRARATVTTSASFWRGALNRLDIGANGGLSLGRALDLYATTVGTLVDTTLLPGGQPSASLSRGFVGVRARPLWWLTVDAHYAHDQIVADREMVARLGDIRWISDPRESAWLQVRFSPDPMISVSLSGNYGFGYAAAEQQGTAGRVTLRHLLLDGSRLALGYRFNQTQAVRTQVADVDLSVPVGDLLDLGAGYSFTTFQARRLDERQDEHRVSLGADLLMAGPWRLGVRGEYALGTLASQLSVLAQLGWRFK